MSQSQTSPASPAAMRRPPIRRDLIEGPIGKTLFLFALPVLGGNALQNLNGTVNAFWVSHTLGEAAVAAISNANMIMFLMLGLVFGVNMASNIMVAQSVGAGDMTMVKRVVGTATTFFVGLSVFMSIVGALLTPAILTAMGTPADARAEAIVYLRVIFAAMPFLNYFIFLQMGQRGAGDSKTPFYFLLLAVVLDVVLNPLLIRGIGPFPRLGIAGAAVSTWTAQGISLAGLMVFLYRSHSPLMLRAGDLHLLKPDPEILKGLMKGLPMGIQMIVISLAGIFMITLVNGYGSLTTAAFGASQQVWMYVQMPAMALGASVSSMAAQNIGAQRWDRVSRVALVGVGQGLAVTGSVVAVLYLLGDLVLQLFLPAGSASLPIAHHINTVVLWAFMLFSITFTLSGIVRSTGAVWPPLFILIVSMFVIRLPFALALIPRFGAEAIWWSFPLGFVISAAMTIGYYRYGNWKKARFMRGGPGGPPPEEPKAEPIVAVAEPVGAES